MAAVEYAATRMVMTAARRMRGFLSPLAYRPASAADGPSVVILNLIVNCLLFQRLPLFGYEPAYVDFFGLSNTRLTPQAFPRVDGRVSSRCHGHEVRARELLAIRLSAFRYAADIPLRAEQVRPIIAKPDLPVHTSKGGVVLDGCRGQV